MKERLVEVSDIPVVHVLMRVESDLNQLNLFLDTKKERIEAVANLRLSFKKVLDFRMSREDGFLGREFSNDETYERGKLYKIEASKYLEYFMSMNPAAEAIYGEIEHYFLLDTQGFSGIDILVSARFNQVQVQKL